MIKVGVTGGIGSGKTLVCSVISAMGYPVFNADVEARQLVDSNIQVISAIKNLLGENIYINNQLNRKKVADIVFSNQTQLEALNAIVHPAVALHFVEWLNNHKNFELIVKEAAILFESGAHHSLDKNIIVTSPLEVRIKRVMERDGINRDSILDRMKNQLPQEELIKRGDYTIENDGVKLILPQIVRVINDILKDS